jgi:Rhodopirellula transposase DDE domain
MGRKRHPKAKRLMVIADSGGSSSYRARLWKVELQKFANNLKLPITVCHLPPGTSKWNKIEHRYSRSLPSTGEASRCAVVGLSSN